MMSNTKLAGVVLLIAGLILVFFGWQSSQSVGDQVVEMATGRFTDDTMWYLIGGIIIAVAGFFIAFIKK
ncbi:MAG: DUF3185 family protein [Porticoccaceae bacterium]